MATGFTGVFEKILPTALPEPSDFIINDFNRMLQSALGPLAPLKLTSSHSNLGSLWRNEDHKKNKQEFQCGREENGGKTKL